MRVWFHENSFLGLKFVLLLHDFKIIKYFGMNDNELIIDLISQTNDICISAKKSAKKYGT